MTSPSADLVADAAPRIETGIGVLEDELHALAQASLRGLVEASEIGAFEQHLSGGRLQERQQKTPDRALARTALADQADGFAARESDVELGDGLDRGTTEKQPARR